MQTITRQQARQFILSKQGLIGQYRFIGKDGAYVYVCQAGCIQLDPFDVCGKNAELTLQSRVKNFKKTMLHDLLSSRANDFLLPSFGPFEQGPILFQYPKWLI